MSLDYEDIEKRTFERYMASYAERDARNAARFARIVPAGDIIVPVDREADRNIAAVHARDTVEALRDLIDGGYWCRKDRDDISKFL